MSFDNPNLSLFFVGIFLLLMLIGFLIAVVFLGLQHLFHQSDVEQKSTEVVKANPFKTIVTLSAFYVLMASTLMAIMFVPVAFLPKHWGLATTITLFALIVLVWGKLWQQKKEVLILGAVYFVVLLLALIFDGVFPVVGLWIKNLLYGVVGLGLLALTIIVVLGVILSLLRFLSCLCKS
jgi:hypothetical protein